MRTLRTLRISVLAAVVVVSGFGFLPSASADNATATSPMAPTYTIQAHVYKDWGIPRTTRWVTSAWTYHGAARQSMTRIRDTTTLASSVGTFTWSCSVGLSGESPTGNCTGTPGSGTYSTTLYWENGNTYESDINGYMYLSWNTTWDQVCASASAYSSPLGIHGNTSACVG